MAEYRLSKAVWKWIPSRRKKRERYRKTWGDNIRRAMNERKLEEEQALNREE